MHTRLTAPTFLEYSGAIGRRPGMLAVGHTREGELESKRDECLAYRLSHGENAGE